MIQLTLLFKKKSRKNVILCMFNLTKSVKNKKKLLLEEPFKCVALHHFSIISMTNNHIVLLGMMFVIPTVCN